MDPTEYLLIPSLFSSAASLSSLLVKGTSVLCKSARPVKSSLLTNIKLNEKAKTTTLYYRICSKTKHKKDIRRKTRIS
jgi:hypothetical protein